MIVDTGFTDFLALPRALIDALHLPFREVVYFELADGGKSAMEVFRADILWDQKHRGVLAVATDGAPLLGMAIIEGLRLTIEAVEGGRVVIEKISDR